MSLQIDLHLFNGEDASGSELSTTESNPLDLPVEDFLNVRGQGVGRKVLGREIIHQAHVL